MKSINKHLNEALGSNLERMIEIIQQYAPEYEQIFDDTVFGPDDFDGLFSVLDDNDKSMLVALMHFTDSNLYRGSQDPKEIAKFFLKIKKKRLDSFMGVGSDGIAFDFGNYIIKLNTNTDNYTLNEVFDRWTKTKGLKVIPEIIRYDKSNNPPAWIALPKFKTGTEKCKLLAKGIQVLYTTSEDEWEGQLDKFRHYFKDDSDWMLQWYRDFNADFVKIMNCKPSQVSDDIRVPNLGEDKDGNVWCFDWIDVYCYNG